MKLVRRRWAEAARLQGTMYAAQIPQQALALLERAGLAQKSITVLRGVQGIEYRFDPGAMKFLAALFEEVP